MSLASRQALCLTLCLAPFLAPPAQAATDADGVCPARTEAWPTRLALIHENDFFGNSDRDYTSGVLLTLHSAELSRRLADRCAALPFRGATALLNRWLDTSLGTRSQSFGLGQQIFTPSNHVAVEMIRSDRPYAGWLFGRLSVHAHDELRSQTLALELGMLGPIAQGEQAQNFFHSIEGYARFQGWRNQLRNELGVQLYRENRQALWRDPSGKLALIGHYGFSLGNILTYANTGARLNLGGDPISGSRAATTMQPTAALTAPGLNAFAALDLRAVARNAFLDGNSFQDSARIGRKPLAADLSLGLSANLLRSADLSFVYTVRSHEFDGQSYTQRFGSLMLSFTP